MEELQNQRHSLEKLFDRYELLKTQAMDIDRQISQTLQDIDVCRRSVNTLELLNNISLFDANNVVSASIYDLNPSIFFFKKFVDSPKLLLLLRGTVIWNRIPYGLLISKTTTADINLHDCKAARLTASYIAKKEQIFVHSQKVVFEATSRPKEERERFLIEEILKIENKGMSPESICRPTAFDTPCAFYAQTPIYRESGSFGSEYYGSQITKQGLNYGDAAIFACIGIVPYECYNTPEIRSTEY